MKCDNLIFIVGVLKGSIFEFYVFSFSVGKLGKGYVRNKVYAYEDYIEYKSSLSK